MALRFRGSDWRRTREQQNHGNQGPKLTVLNLKLPLMGVKLHIGPTWAAVNAKLHTGMHFLQQSLYFILHAALHLLWLTFYSGYCDCSHLFKPLIAAMITYSYHSLGL